MTITTPTMTSFDVSRVRNRFSSLADNGFAFLDAPGGSQVPDEVGDSIAQVLRVASANLGAFYPSSLRVGEIVEEARLRAAALMGGSPGNIVFGPSMTNLNFTLTRTAARDFVEGDEIVVTRLDHDANVAPWRELAADKGLVIRIADTTDDFEIDMEHLASLLNERTKVVAFPWASNAVGTVTDAKAICDLAHSVGAIAWVDAVQFAAHRTVDARAIGADVILCSAYKFCGPHVAIAHVTTELADTWRPYKVLARGLDHVGYRFETGTAAFEQLGGLITTFDYLDSVGGFDIIQPYEDMLARYMVDTVPSEVQLYGPPLDSRVPTFLFTIDGIPAEEIARTLAEEGVGVWHHTHWFAMNLAERLPSESVRVGLAHYNTTDEIDRFTRALSDLIGAR